MPPKSNNLVLIGMPGVGKSTVGVLLAKRLGFGFVDTDILIQTRESLSLQQLIAEHGLDGFCLLEARHILSLQLTGHVIATGGSVVYDADAMQHLRAGGRIVHLDLSPERLQRRLDDVVERGVVMEPGKSLRDLYEERRPLYLAHADLTIDTNDLSPAQVVERVFGRMDASKSER